MGKVIVLLLLIGSLSGCGLTGEGHILVAGDAQGMRSFGDALNGLVTNGKASADQDTAHWIARKSEDVQLTTRAGQGFWQKLVGGEK
jgi:hypothetical protein